MLSQIFKILNNYAPDWQVNADIARLFSCFLTVQVYFPSSHRLDHLVLVQGAPVNIQATFQIPMI